MPETTEAVIKSATFMEDKLALASSDRVKAWQQSCASSPTDPMERLVKAMDRMALSFKMAKNVRITPPEPAQILY